jgi:hypothetical protein
MCLHDQPGHELHSHLRIDRDGHTLSIGIAVEQCNEHRVRPIACAVNGLALILECVGVSRGKCSWKLADFKITRRANVIARVAMT